MTAKLDEPGEELLQLKSNIHHFVLATVSERLVANIHGNYFLVADWSESQELEQ